MCLGHKKSFSPTEIHTIVYQLYEMEIAHSVFNTQLVDRMEGCFFSISRVVQPFWLSSSSFSRCSLSRHSHIVFIPFILRIGCLFFWISRSSHISAIRSGFPPHFAVSGYLSRHQHLFCFSSAVYENGSYRCIVVVRVLLSVWRYLFRHTVSTPKLPAACYLTSNI